MKDLYTFVVGSQDRKRHLISATGEDSAFPRALCTAGIRLRDDSAAPSCKDCRRIALSYIAIALSRFGLDRLGVKVASEARLLSFGDEEAPAELTA